MFLRRYSRTKDGKDHFYYALVESVRTDSGPRQHIVAHLGELNHDQERRWQRTVTFYNRQGDAQQLRLFPEDDSIPLPADPDVVRIRLSSVGWSNGRRFGDVWLARWLWHYVGLDVIVARHLPQGKETVPPADIVAIEVINRLCQPCSEFALAEHWYASTGLEDLLGVPDGEVTKDRFYRTLDRLRRAQEPIENDLKDGFGTLFQIDYELLLYDLTSSYFEGLADENDLAARGYSRDHRSDCPQVVLALVVTREGFPLAHYTLPGNSQDVQTVEKVVKAIEKRFGKSQRVWVMDRGMISKETLAFLGKSGRRYLLATKRSALASFQKELRTRDLKKLQSRVAKGRLKKRDKIAEAIGKLKERYPKARGFVEITISDSPQSLTYTWKVVKFKAALARDGAYLLRSNQGGWSAQEFWETYIQLTVVERAFRVLKSELLLRPIWHHYSGRTEAHIFVCVLAYALWKTLDHLVKRAGLETLIHKPDPDRDTAAPQPRPMTPEAVLRELSKIQIGDIELETVTGQKLVLRRVARPTGEQKRILEALNLELPERLSSDRLL